MAKNIATVPAATPANAQTVLLAPALRARLLLARLAEKFGGLIERVDPKDFIQPQPNGAVMEKLLAGEIEDWSSLMSIFGTKTYANKAKLASEGNTFRITRLVERVNGGYNKESDWAFEISVDDGSTQVLSMEKNASRDFMVYVLVAGLTKFGASDPLQLSMIELAETDTRPAGRFFYSLEPVSVKVAEKNVTATYEG